MSFNDPHIAAERGLLWFGIVAGATNPVISLGLLLSRLGGATSRRVVAGVALAVIAAQVAFLFLGTLDAFLGALVPRRDLRGLFLLLFCWTILETIACLATLISGGR